MARPETQEEVTASLIKWADLAAPRAKERKEKLDKEQQERWAKESKGGGGPYGGRFGGMHGGYGGHPYGDGMARGYPYGGDMDEQVGEDGKPKGNEEWNKYSDEDLLETKFGNTDEAEKQMADAPTEGQAAEASAEAGAVPGQVADASAEPGAVPATEPAEFAA